jgi:hypothetical protein
MVNFRKSSISCLPGQKFSNTDLKWLQESSWTEWGSTALVSKFRQLQANVRKLRLKQIDEMKTKKWENKARHDSVNTHNHELMKKIELQALAQMKTPTANETWISWRPKLEPSNPNLSAAFFDQSHATFREICLKTASEMYQYRCHVSARQKRVVKLCEMKWTLGNILLTLHGHTCPQNKKRVISKRICLVLS